jgi:RHS repeat-associated protein
LSPYGEVITGSGDERLLFTQHERDTENESDSTVYRQYASTQGRWLSPDPYSGSYNLADPQSLNRYAYLSGRPLSAVDSIGLDDGGGLGGIFGLLPGIGLGLYELFTSGGGHHAGPPSTVNTGYGNPYDTSGSVIFPGYVTQLSSDPGSLGESLDIPSSIPHGVWGIGPSLGLPSGSCAFGACGGFDFTQPGQDSNQANQGYSPWNPPYLPSNRHAQGPRPGTPTPRNIPTEDPGAEPQLGPTNEPPPTNSGRFWYTLMQLLRIIDNDLNPPAIPVLVNPSVLCGMSPTSGPYRPPYCPPPAL